jgi:hypothetical protein
VIDLEFAALEREVGMVFRAIGKAAERARTTTDLRR